MYRKPLTGMWDTLVNDVRLQKKSYNEKRAIFNCIQYCNINIPLIFRRTTESASTKIRLSLSATLQEERRIGRRKRKKIIRAPIDC